MGSNFVSGHKLKFTDWSIKSTNQSRGNEVKQKTATESGRKRGGLDAKAYRWKFYCKHVNLKSVSLSLSLSLAHSCQLMRTM